MRTLKDSTLTLSSGVDDGIALPREVLQRSRESRLRRRPSSEDSNLTALLHFILEFQGPH